MKGLLVLICLVALKAQGVPDAASILESSRHALDRYQSYQLQSTVTVTTTLPSGAKNPPVLISASVAEMSPGKVRIESETRAVVMTAGVATVVSDGQTTWTYEKERNAYRKQAEEGSIDALLDLVGAWSGSLPEDAGASSGTVREESIEVDDEKHECWVVEKTVSRIRPFSWLFQFRQGPDLDLTSRSRRLKALSFLIDFALQRAISYSSHASIESPRRIRLYRHHPDPRLQPVE